jgi:diguanylate cyclase (GGDEF)-like protein
MVPPAPAVMDTPLLARESLGSPFAEQLRQGFPRLQFDGLLEKEFRDFYIAHNRPRGQLSGLIALVLVLALSSIDFLLGVGDPGSPVSLLRLCVLCPLLVVLVVATYLPALESHYPQVAATGVLLIGFVTTAICQLAALAGNTYLLSGSMLVVLYACLFLGLRFKIAVAISGTLVAVFLISGHVVDLPLAQLYYSTAMLGTTAVIGGISAHNFEHALRTNFLETRLLNELAERDGLTGLYNRRMFDDFIQRVWRQSRREEVALEIIFIDIDYFKIYNDLYGHQAGDDCLKKVAQAIARCAKRPFDFAARYGGEEFVLVLYGPPADYARSVPDQIRQDVAALGIVHEGSQVAKHVTVSVGVGLARPGGNRSLAGAIQTADEALYQAKREGRNAAVFRDADDGEVETGNFRVMRREIA